MIIIQKHLEFYGNIIDATDINIVYFNADNSVTDSFNVKTKVTDKQAAMAQKMLKFWYHWNT